MKQNKGYVLWESCKSLADDGVYLCMDDYDYPVMQ